MIYNLSPTAPPGIWKTEAWAPEDGSFLQDSLLKGFEEKQVVSNLWGMEG